MSSELKTHYKTDDTGYAVCIDKKKFKQLTFNVEEVTCERCKGTKVWMDDMSIKERERKASCGELGGLKYSCMIIASSKEHDKYIKFCVKSLTNTASNHVQTTNISNQHKREYFFVSKEEREEFQMMVSNMDSTEEKTAYVMKNNISMIEFFKIVDMVCIEEDEYSVNDYNLIKNAKYIYAEINSRKFKCDGINTNYSYLGLQHKLLNKKEEPKMWIDESEEVCKHLKKSKYDKPCKGQLIDVYDVLKAFDVVNPATQHAIKKLLCPGERGSKDLLTDLNEALSSIKRAIELEKE